MLAWKCLHLIDGEQPQHVLDELMLAIHELTQHSAKVEILKCKTVLVHALSSLLGTFSPKNVSDHNTSGAITRHDIVLKWKF